MEEQKKRGGCLKIGAIGCLVVLILAIVGGYLALKYVKGKISQYTSTEQIELPAVDASQQEISDTLSRVNAFMTAIDKSDLTEPLYLTSRDVNILINNHPAWNNMAGKVYVTLEGDQAKGDISIPLGPLNDMFKGKYLNGSASLRIGMDDMGEFYAFLNSIDVGGEKIPDQFMEAFSKENFARGFVKDPNIAEILDKFESITVKNGKLILYPKKG